MGSRRIRADYVSLKGTKICLGVYGTPESGQKNHRVLAEWEGMLFHLEPISNQALCPD